MKSVAFTSLIFSLVLLLAFRFLGVHPHSAYSEPSVSLRQVVAAETGTPRTMRPSDVSTSDDSMSEPTGAFFPWVLKIISCVLSSLTLTIVSRFNPFDMFPAYLALTGPGTCLSKVGIWSLVHSRSSDLETLTDTPGTPDDLSNLSILAVRHRQHKRFDLINVWFAVG